MKKRLLQQEIPWEVLDAFCLMGENVPDPNTAIKAVEKIGHGLINQSWKIILSFKPDILLQQLNLHVFPYPELVQENYINLWQYAEYEMTGISMPAPVFYGGYKTLFTDNEGNCWRAFEFIHHSITMQTASSPEQARAAARAFARFTAAFSDLNLKQLHPVIPDFHNLSLRFRQLEESLETELYERMGKAQSLIQELRQRERYKHFFDIITESDEFSQRVMHHDAKISNILFHKQTGRVICPVDYDTAMPGYFFSDIGDMIRSMACTLDESDVHSKPQLRKSFYENLLTGYTDVLGGQFSFNERKYMHSAGLMMTYMQALRFATDYLSGDSYYKINYLEQNFDRAMNQLMLLQSLEEFLKSEYNFKI